MLSSGADNSELRPRGPFTGSHMLNVRNARQRSEQDVELLRNRLGRLEQEERKTLKKIEETRRRADQIIQLKIRNEQNAVRKQLEGQYAEQQRERARERLQQHKAEMSSGVAEQQEALLQQKRAEADQLRQQRADIGTHQHNTKRLAQQRMRAMADAQKLHAQEVQQQKMQQRMLHEEELQRRRWNSFLQRVILGCRVRKGPNERPMW